MQCRLGQRLPSYPVAFWFIQSFCHNKHARKVGAVHLFRGAGSPSNTMSRALRPTSVLSGILINPAVWPQQTWAENWGAVPLLGKEMGSHVRQFSLGRGQPPCQVTTWSIQPFGHNTWAKSGGCCPPFLGEMGLHITQYRLGRGLPPYQVASWSN